MKEFLPQFYVNLQPKNEEEKNKKIEEEKRKHNVSLLLFQFEMQVTLLFDICTHSFPCAFFFFPKCPVLQMAMQGFTEKIVQMMKSESLFESQGGPIILSQV